MRKIAIILSVLVLTTSSCGQNNNNQGSNMDKKLKNNRVYEIWAFMTVSLSDEAIAAGMEGPGLSPNYDLIKSLPLPYKKIVAYYTLKAGYISTSTDMSLAKAFGQYTTLKEAQDSLLIDWKYFEILTDDWIHRLELMRSGNKVAALLPNWDSFLRDIHIFEIDKNNEIIYLGHYKNIKYNPPYDEKPEIEHLIINTK